MGHMIKLYEKDPVMTKRKRERRSTTMIKRRRPERGQRRQRKAGE